MLLLLSWSNCSGRLSSNWLCDGGRRPYSLESLGSGIRVSLHLKAWASSTLLVPIRDPCQVTPNALS